MIEKKMRMNAILCKRRLKHSSSHIVCIFPPEKTQETCECPTKNCEGNILKNIIDNKILTSGYFGLKNKPKGNSTFSQTELHEIYRDTFNTSHLDAYCHFLTGKCSHGGPGDFTTGLKKSLDGINKDASDSSHGSLHNKAADVAIDASVQLLEMIGKNIEEPNFFRYTRGLKSLSNFMSQAKKIPLMYYKIVNITV